VTDNAAVLRLLRLRGAEGVTPLLALQEVGCFRLGAACSTFERRWVTGSSGSG
jgi:hypothetical protein